jgi:hypothetical protein
MSSFSIKRSIDPKIPLSEVFHENAQYQFDNFLVNGRFYELHKTPKSD